jgi:hypothetical protein
MAEAYAQTLVIRDAVVADDPRCADHMRVQLEKACEAAKQVLRAAASAPARGE